MKMKTLPLCLLSVLACGGFLSTSVQATQNIDLTVTTNVKTGTCNAVMQNGGGTPITQVTFTGPIYTDDIKNGTKSELFQISLTGCAGIPGKKHLFPLPLQQVFLVITTVRAAILLTAIQPQRVEQMPSR